MFICQMNLNTMMVYDLQFCTSSLRFQNTKHVGDFVLSTSQDCRHLLDLDLMQHEK
jgi:hypothetical protein